MKKIPIIYIKGGIRNMDMFKVGNVSYNYRTGYMKGRTQKSCEKLPVDVDTVEISGYSQIPFEKIQEELKSVYEDDGEEDIFEVFDKAMKVLKKEAEDFVRYIEEYKEIKYKERQKIKKYRQQQKVLQKAALMKATGLLWVSELSIEAKQEVMSKYPKAIADYKLKKKLEKKAAEKRHNEI